MKQLLLPLALLAVLIIPSLVGAAADTDTLHCGLEEHHCGTPTSGRVQLCHFNGFEFQTLCIRQSQTASLLRSNHDEQAPDYCGPCTTHKPLESTEELRQAVLQYEGQDHYNVELAMQYGWPMNRWNVTLITDFSEVFAHSPLKEEDLSDWDVSSATSMARMFYQAEHLEDGGLWKWDVRQVEDMEEMFYGAKSFNGDITEWDTQSLTNTKGTFEKASKFDQELRRWDTSKLIYASRMFAQATSFDQDLGDWDTRQLQDASFMFLQATSFSQDLSAWELDRIQTLQGMFDQVPHFTLASQKTRNTRVKNTDETPGGGEDDE